MCLARESTLFWIGIVTEDGVNRFSMCIFVQLDVDNVIHVNFDTLYIYVEGYALPSAFHYGCVLNLMCIKAIHVTAIYDAAIRECTTI